MSMLKAVLRVLKKEEEQLNRELAGITAAIAAFGKTYANGKSARNLSVAGRARIAAAQKARWAKARKAQKIVSISQRKKSATTGKKVTAAPKVRWAKKAKTAKKSA